MARLLRTEILKIKDSQHAFPNWQIETFGNGGHLIVLSRLAEDWRPGDNVHSSFDLDFVEARTLAIAILRAVYFEMPQTWYLAEGDPEEYLAHVLEILYESVPRKEANPRDGIKNLLALIQSYKKALVRIGKERKERNRWQRRYEHVAKWARLNQRRLEEQRRQLKALNRKVIEISHGQKCGLSEKPESTHSSRSDSLGHGGQEGV